MQVTDQHRVSARLSIDSEKWSTITLSKNYYIRRYVRMYTLIIIIETYYSWCTCTYMYYYEIDAGLTTKDIFQLLIRRGLPQTNFKRVLGWPIIELHSNSCCTLLQKQKGKNIILRLPNKWATTDLPLGCAFCFQFHDINSNRCLWY